MRRLRSPTRSESSNRIAVSTVFFSTLPSRINQCACECCCDSTSVAMRSDRCSRLGVGARRSRLLLQSLSATRYTTIINDDSSPRSAAQTLKSSQSHAADKSSLCCNCPWRREYAVISLWWMSLCLAAACSPLSTACPARQRRPPSPLHFTVEKSLLAPLYLRDNLRYETQTFSNSRQEPYLQCVQTTAAVRLN